MNIKEREPAVVYTTPANDWSAANAVIALVVVAVLAFIVYYFSVMNANRVESTSTTINQQPPTIIQTPSPPVIVPAQTPPMVPIDVQPPARSSIDSSTAPAPVQSNTAQPDKVNSTDSDKAPMQNAATP